MNLLFTSSGRRRYLLKYFRDAMEDGDKIFAANSIDGVPSFYEADECVVTPMIYDDNYIPFLIEFCKENHIDAVLSLYDVDIPVLAHNRNLFNSIGTHLLVSDESFVRICNDKWLSYQYLMQHGFHTPRTYINISNAINAIDNKEISYPVIVKPRFGNGSMSTCIAYDEDELRMLFKLTESQINRSWLKFESDQVKEKVIIQEMLNGDEYGLDILNNIDDGSFVCANIKKKIAMRSGETDRAIVVKDKLIEQEALRLGVTTGHMGNLDCDGFLCGEEFYILEMNARFGGGYPFSHIAGANYPKIILSWLKHTAIDTNDYFARAGVEAYKNIEICVSGKELA